MARQPSRRICAVVVAAALLGLASAACPGYVQMIQTTDVYASNHVPFPTTALSVGAWVRLDGSATPANGHTLLSYWAGEGSGSEEFYFVLSTSAGTIGVNGVAMNVLPSGIPGDRWVHLLFTWQSSNGLWNMYVNGGATTTTNYQAAASTLTTGEYLVRVQPAAVLQRVWLVLATHTLAAPPDASDDK